MAKVDLDLDSGNSIKNRDPDQKKKEVVKVTKGKVSTAKKSPGKKFVETFIEEDAEDIKVYIVSDVIIPAIKNLIFDSLIGSVEMALFGTASRSRRRGGNGGRSETTSYSSYYRSGSNSNRSNRDSSEPRRGGYQDIIFDERGDAEEVLDTLQDLIEEFGQATIGDFYDACGITPDDNFSKNENYGWTNLNSASVKSSRDGYFIHMPREKYLG